MDVLCIGAIFMDHIFQVEQVPPRGGDAVSRRYARSLGGCAANVALGTAKLGLRTAVIGVIGDDPESAHAEAEFAKAGVLTQHLQQIEGETLGACVCMIEEGSGQPTYVSHFGVIHRFGPEHVPAGLGGQARWLYVSGYDLLVPESRAAVWRAIEAHRQGGGNVLFDMCPALVFEGGVDELDRLLAAADVVTGTEQEIAFLAGGDAESDLARFAEQLLAGGARYVHMKRGEKGSSLFSKAGRLDRAACSDPSLPIVDTTGAGDAYVSALLYALVNDWSPERTLALCNAYGYLACTKLGATAGLLPLPDLQARELVSLEK